MPKGKSCRWLSVSGASGERIENMKKSTELAIEALRNALKDEVSDDCVAVNVFFNAESHEIEFRCRTAESLQRDSISMRNLRGDWVK